MTGKIVGNNRFLKEFNQTAILDMIRVHRAISRAELSKLTGLSPTAIGSIVSELLEIGYISETGIGESKGGRRPVLIEIKPESLYTIGIDMDVNYISFVLMDTTSRIIEEKMLTMPKTIIFENVMKVIQKEIKRILKDHSITLERLLGIGLSVPGMVDSLEGKVIFAPNMGWENVDIRGQFPDLKGVNVYVENEAMASAISENWIGTCQGISNFVCVNIKSGIGSGIFIDGKPYRGTSGITGELGHMVVDSNGSKCRCGNYGCLETIASTTHMVEQAKRLVKSGIASKLNDIEDVEEIDAKSIIDCAREGDEVSRNILLESARFLGLAVSSIVNILSPQKIVLGKDFVNYSDIVLDSLKEIVMCKALKQTSKDIEITESKLGERASVLGSAIIPLKVFFGK
ncbi:ROK family transcriptional regulator [Pseudobacteroides cellulosolvens]|uniref:Glucokinase n=1 Tax=Pseudobacteroides cellulosolvens ATCC 35603 = DSM 2933 TaxID=398512 RepID=A0A0L6JIT0_9FIRM|nr:ROK family transcriptional regulator [Pseudobacteroides cellulosolvens]KNY25603.1 Glucokinase [Pseudobacteroides cellulosolvens ATCC 35603 = DSM 2933]